MQATAACATWRETGTAFWKAALVPHQHGFGQRALHRCRLQPPVCCRAAGSGTGASCVLQPFLHPMGYVPYFSLISGLLLCDPEARSFPAAPQQKRQRCLKVSFVPHFSLENGNIPWKIGCMEVMPLPTSATYLLLISRFLIFPCRRPFKQHFFLRRTFDTQTSSSCFLPPPPLLSSLHNLPDFLTAPLLVQR